MRRMTILISALVLGLTMTTLHGLASGKKVQSSLSQQHLDNFNLLISLSRAGISTSEATSVDLQDYQEKTLTGRITSEVEIRHAIIYGYGGQEIPDFLIDEFDRISKMVLDYIGVEYGVEKIVIWVMDFESLQQIPWGPDSCFRGCPTTLAALYAPLFNYVILCPQYLNDYYMAHEYLHYCTDEHERMVVEALPELIRRQGGGSISLRNFLLKNEERIVIELSQIIIQKYLASYSLKGVISED